MKIYCVIGGYDHEGYLSPDYCGENENEAAAVFKRLSTKKSTYDTVEYQTWENGKQLASYEWSREP